MKKVGALRFHVENSVLYFQEKNSHTGIVGPSEAHVTTLRVNLRDGSIGTFLEAPFPGNSSVVLGIIGLLNLHGGSVIVLVSKAKQVKKCGFVIHNTVQVYTKQLEIIISIFTGLLASSRCL